MTRVQPLLLAALMLCLSVPILLLGEGLIDGWRGGYFLILVPFAVLEGIWSKRIYKRERIYGLSLIWRLTTEIVVLVLFAKLFHYLGRGIGELMQDVLLWLRKPSAFFTGETVLVGLAVILFWGSGQRVHSELERTSDPFETGPARQAARERVRGFVILGGFWLLALSGLIFGLSDQTLTINNRGALSLQVAVILYLGLSLLLMAHVQYLRRQMEWQMEGLTVPASVRRRWVGWGLILTIAIFFIAAVLPAVYVIGPDRLLSWVLNLFYYFTQIITVIIMFLLSPVVWLMSLFTGEDTTPSPQIPEFPQLSPSIDVQAPLWWMQLRQILLVVGIVFVLALVLYTYSRNRRVNLPQVPDIWKRFMRLLLEIWAWMERLYAGARRGWNTMQMRRRPSRTVPERGRARLPLVQARTPRARIRRYYLSLLRRTDEGDLRRHPQQTPDEYATWLASHVPEHQAEVAVLTEAFIHARYDTSEPLEEHVPPVHEAWRILRNSIRERRNQ
jgi:hypothetical protein